MTVVDFPDKPGRPMLIGIIVYLLTILSMATVGAIVPSMMRICASMHATPAEVGIAISMFSLPSALLGVLGGRIDRFGHVRTLLYSGAVAVAADLMIYFSSSLLTLDFGLLITGLAFTGISIAAPAYLMNTLDGADRARAISLWSTYGPTGYAVGLIIAAPFTTSERWQLPLLVAGSLLAACTIAAWIILPSDNHAAWNSVAATPREQARDVIRMLFRQDFARLAFAFSVPTAISYGTGIVAPSFISQTYGVSIGSSAVVVATAKIAAMVLGGVAVGHMLARNMNIHRLFGTTILVGLVAQILLFAPLAGVGVAVAGLIIWLFALSGISATSMMLLPAVSPDPSKRALAAGLIGQVMSLLCLIAPPLYFSLHWWGGFVIIALVGLLFGFAILPGQRIAPPANTAVAAI